MASSPRHHENANPSPTTTLTSPTRPVTRSEPMNPYPTTFVQADTSSFKQVVQMLTGSPTNPQPDPAPKPHHHHSIPPIKSNSKKQNPSSGFRLYERRNSLKNNFKISPLNPGLNPGSGRKPDTVLSPSMLDFPSLALSPVTPLIADPFERSGSASASSSPGSYCFVRNNAVTDGVSLDRGAEERAIREKGFYLHPSPATTPRESEPRLLPLFPLTSPGASGSSSSAS